MALGTERRDYERVAWNDLEHIVLTGIDLGRMLAIARDGLDLLESRGLLTRAPSGRGYIMTKSVPAVVAHYRNVASGRSIDDGENLNLTRERARNMARAADEKELKIAQLRGELVNAAEVEERVAAEWRAVSSRLLSVVSRVRQRLGHLSMADIDVIDREIRDALTEIAYGQD